MIIRQFCARHGRGAALKSSRPSCRRPASGTSDGIKTPSTTSRASVIQITGHPDEASSILDTSLHAPTRATRAVEDSLKSTSSAAKTLESDINSHVSARILTLPDDISSKKPEASSQKQSKKPKHLRTTQLPPKRSPPPFKSLKDLYKARQLKAQTSQQGTFLKDTYEPDTLLRKPPTADELNLPMLLANQTHLGHATSLWHPGNNSYIFGIRDGIHIISLDTTFAYLRRAAKVVQEVARRGGIIVFLGTRKGQEDIVVKSAKLATGYHIFDRWVPGSLTNGQQILAGCAIKVVDIADHELPQYTTKLAGERPVLRPDLVICLNPIENEVCLHECGLYTVPTIGVVDTDCNPSWVTYPIPANDDSLRSIALIAGVLGRAGQEGQRLRLEYAKQHGRATYSTAPVGNFLERVEEIAEMDVNEGDDSV